MINVFSVPETFLKYDLALELLFALITGLLAAMAFGIYRMSRHYQAKFFGAAFTLISVSYLAQGLTSIFIITPLDESIDLASDALTLTDVNNLGANMHILLFTAGLVTLAYMTMGVRNWKVYTAIMLASTLGFVMSSNRLLFFYMLSVILFALVAYHYLVNYLRQRSVEALIVTIAFILLFIRSVYFVFSIGSETAYIIARVSAFAAYLLILVNLVRVKKNG